MEDLLNYRKSGGMLTLEAQSRGVTVKTASTTTNGESAAEPPSLSSVNISSSRFPLHLTASTHQGLQPRRQHPPPPHHFKAQHLFSDEAAQDAGMKKSLPSLQYKVHDSAFCRVLSAEATAAAAFASAAAYSAAMDKDVWKCGYLRKQRHGHKRFFVLRGPSHLGPSRLEYYDSEKKFRNALKSASASTASVMCPPKRVIYLSQCFTVNKRADAKNKYLIALYTKDEYFAMVAENEQEQEEWYQAFNNWMTEGKKGQLDPEELDDGYGTISPGTIFKEVWQVNVKPKGLGQTKNLMGVYRLCLSAKTIHLVKLNSETASVNLPLMNIRRCGHSESFFFIEVGRSSSIGPGEIWVQVEDSVVAQNMHETILETMRALKAFPEFRPRSKSQSSGSNQIPFITTRRHLGNLPPRQTGLRRCARVDSMTGTPPKGKSKGGNDRFRTSSEGDGTIGRPLSSGTGSLVHLNTPCVNMCREESGGLCCVPTSPGSSSTHAPVRSVSQPASHFLSATSPISVSSSSGHGSASDTHTRPSSSSICGSPSDGGFNSSDEFCSSPCDFRYFRARSSTPESLCGTPPVRDDFRLMDYMAMDRYQLHYHHDLHGERAKTFEEESSYMERAFIKLSLASKAKSAVGGGLMQQKATQTSSSLDESSPVESKHHPTSACSPKSDYKPYAEVSHHPSKPTFQFTSDVRRKLYEDDGYVPMTFATSSGSSRKADYIPMHPSILHPSTLDIQCVQPSQQNADSYMLMQPGEGRSSHALSSPSCGRTPMEYNDYMDMSFSHAAEVYVQSPPPDTPKSHSSYFSLPRSYKTPLREKSGQMDMSAETPTDLDSPPSPGEYIHMDFGDHLTRSPTSSPTVTAPFASACDPHCAPLGQDYMGLDMDSLLFKGRPPRHSLVAPWNPPNYARPAMSAYLQGQTDCLDLEKAYAAGSGAAKSPLGLYQHLCVQEDLQVVRTEAPGRRRHSSETFSHPSGSGRAVCSMKASANSSPPESSSSSSKRWPSSVSCDRSPADDHLSSRPIVPPANLLTVPCSGAGRGQPHSTSYLNYGAFDLREVPGDTDGVPSTYPDQAHGEDEVYASVDFTVSRGSTTASKD
ncbi:insulin receptor substrate 2-B [Alosa alosa]|uniref:insulin receptor substrate 2-B n=1 Tax=Alosa alosa TaxID=278164 RepID=UPI00201552B4|nr:insulin receptor substrate 2-B [Alosa alosa]